MVTGWILSFYIECGWGCYSRGEYDYKSKVNCMEQAELIYDRAIKQGYNVHKAICKPVIASKVK